MRHNQYDDVLEMVESNMTNKEISGAGEMIEYDKESLRIYLSYHVSELRGLHYQVVNRWHEGQAIYGRKKGTFMKCVICNLEHEKEGLEYCVAALIFKNQQLERKYADFTIADCNNCERRGKLNGLSQETYCSGCIHSDTWKKDYFKPKANQCDGCNAGIYKDVKGMHRDKDSNPVMVCQAHRYT